MIPVSILLLVVVFTLISAEFNATWSSKSTEVASLKHAALESAKASTCESITDESTCMSSSEGSEACSWCSSGAVGTSCQTESEAKSLPSAVFECEYQTAYAAYTSDEKPKNTKSEFKKKKESTCEAHMDESSCMSSSEGDEACSWCSSGAVGTSCQKESEAKALPSAVFECEYQTAYAAYVKPSGTCEDITDESTCMSSSEGSEACSWCSSGAVGTSCQTESEAKSLPSAVFECEYQTAYAAYRTESATKTVQSGDLEEPYAPYVIEDKKNIKNVKASGTCEDITDESTCMSSSEGSEACSWCSSGAVGTSCQTESEAKSLPSAVFECEYQTAYAAY